MGLGESVGTRSLVDGKTTKAYCASKAQAGFVAENFTQLKAPELDDLVKLVDRQTAKNQNSRHRLEHMDAFALRRDLRYAMRSRKWFLLRAQQSRLNRSFCGWSTFVAKNLEHGSALKKLPAHNVEQLKGHGFNLVVV